MHRTHYLVWRRGFAPILFILSISLIVVAVGTGIYFATKKSAPAVAEQPVATTSAPVEEVALANQTPTPAIAPAVTPAAIANPVATPKAVVPKAVTYVDCGSTVSAAKCLAEKVQTCSPAKGVVVDAASGLKVERVIDGYKGSDCSYRSTILSATGSMAILNGMNIDCMIPKATLATTLQGGSMSKEDMLALCTGSFIDLIRAQMGAAQ